MWFIRSACCFHFPLLIQLAKHQLPFSIAFWICHHLHGHNSTCCATRAARGNTKARFIPSTEVNRTHRKETNWMSTAHLLLGLVGRSDRWACSDSDEFKYFESNHYWTRIQVTAAIFKHTTWKMKQVRICPHVSVYKILYINTAAGFLVGGCWWALSGWNQRTVPLKTNKKNR